MCCTTALTSYQAETKCRTDSFLCCDTAKTSVEQSSGKLFGLPCPERSNHDNAREILQYLGYQRNCVKQVDRSLHAADARGDAATACPGTDSKLVPATAPTIRSAAE